MDNSKIIQKIKKLLALSESSNVNEAATAARMAAKMMTEYQIEMADVIKAELNRGDGLTTDNISEKTYYNWPLWMQSLSIGVARLFDCQVKYNYIGEKLNLSIMGYEADVQMVKWMYDFLYRELKNICEEACKNKGNVSRSTFRKNFFQGAVTEIKKRMVEMYKENEKSFYSSGTGLIVLKKKLVQKKFGVEKYKKYKRNYNLNNEAYNKGKIAGKDINLNRPLGDSSTEKLN